MLTDTELIRKLDFFEPLDQRIVGKIAKMCIMREFSAGDYVVRQGEAGLGLYFITRGRVRVEIVREGIRVAVAELLPGDFLGELAVIDDKARSADVVCVEDTSCMLLTRDSFNKLLNKYPQIAVQMAKSLVTRIRATNQMVAGHAQPSRVGPAPLAAAASTEPGSERGREPVASSNGASGGGFNPLKLYSTTKNKAKDALVDLFAPLYLLKSVTRFSMAIVGCPVEVQPENRRGEVLQTRIDGVKLALFPAFESQVLQIAAYGDGDYSLTVFRPARSGRSGGSLDASVARFDGRIGKDETMRLHVPARENTWLERA